MVNGFVEALFLGLDLAKVSPSEQDHSKTAIGDTPDCKIEQLKLTR